MSKNRVTEPRSDERLHRLLRAYTAEADMLLEVHANAEGKFYNVDDEAEYQRMVQIIDDAREALGLPTGGER
ncbi:hypothetical protein [Arhodomonas sp. AD133]|uniref:hypothetical protein n=1 Tax=Arhodomonas sp. AD133 TaxID=3415009 RepID=UPI003EC01241